MLDTSSNVENVDLAIEDVLCLLEGVVCGPSWAGFDLVEAGGEVGRCVLGVCADGVEVGDGCVLALRKGNILVASALDDGERNKVSGHLEVVTWSQKKKVRYWG